jgi:hypothetical protein
MRITNQLRAVKLAVATLALAALAACTNTFNADVTHFNSQLPPPAGQTFVVVPENPAKAGGIEFNQYASRVADHMAALGYRPVNNPAEANLIVRFDYGIDHGRERVTSRPGFYDPFWSPWYSTPVIYHTRHGARVGYITRPWGFGWYDPFFGGGGVDSYTVYTSGIDLTIERASDHYRFYEGKAQAELLVKFNYGVDHGREKVTSSPGFYDPFWSPWYSTPVVYHTRHGARIGYLSRPWGFGWYDPFFGGGDIDSYTVYTSGADLKIERASDHYRFYEGKAQAVSMSNRLQYLVPNLVEALFTDFPGNSGQTVRISIAPEGRKVTPRR